MTTATENLEMQIDNFGASALRIKAQRDALIEQLKIAVSFCEQVAVVEEVGGRDGTARIARRYATQFKAAIEVAS